jgi:hypothetical protein
VHLIRIVIQHPLAFVLKAIMRPTLMTGIVLFVTLNVNLVYYSIKIATFAL